MIVVIPCCKKDVHLAVANLAFAIHLDKTSSLKALIAHESDTCIDPVMELAKKFFSGVETFSYDPWTGNTMWPFPQNYAWQEVARHIESKVGQPWFWWEQDAIPLKPGWLDAIDEAYKAGERPFSGAVTSQMGTYYMAGVAVYPKRDRKSVV